MNNSFDGISSNNTQKPFNNDEMEKLSTNTSSLEVNETTGVWFDDNWEWYKDHIKSWIEHPGDESHLDLNLTSPLKMDQAYIVGSTSTSYDVGIYTLSDDCFRVFEFFI